MIKFEQVKGIIDEVTQQLNQLVEKMNNYSKKDTDYRAGAFIEEVNTKIKQMHNAYENVFASENFKKMYGKESNYDYTEYVKMIRDYVPYYEKIYEKIVKFESVFGYYN